VTTLRLATRSSALALYQAHFVRDELLKANLDLSVEIIATSTMGDARHDLPISALGGQGVFVKEVQQLVLDGLADFAVHSAKDLPSSSAPGLTLAAITARGDVRDALVGRTLAGLGPGATVACGAPRRRAVLSNLRPDLNLVELRGNIATRVAKSQERGIDAVVIALTALERLGLENQVAEIFDPEVMIPQVGQGAFGVECRSDDEVAIEVLRVVNDQDAQRTVTAERAFLAELGAGCSVPVGAWATTHGDDVFIRAMLASPDGHEILRTTATGKDPEQLGAAVAAQLRDELGGARIISSWHRPTTG
jgi:hydroxymethylbilane synthase